MKRLHSVASLIFNKASIIVLVLFILLSPVNTYAAVNVSLNGQQITFPQQPFLDESAGRLLVPFRQLFEALGADVWYDSRSKSAFGKMNNTIIQLPLNQKIAYLNSEKIYLDAPTLIHNDYTMVPLRFVSETWGYNVEADFLGDDLFININSADFNLVRSDLNSFVLNIIETYNGDYPYLLNTDYKNYNGVTTNLYYQDKILAKAHPSGNKASHCVGLTFEVFFKAMQQRNQVLGKDIDNFNGLSWDDLYDFMLIWFVADGNKSTSNLAIALEKYGLGTGISNLENAKPGDFIDLSRENNTGHTAVFIDWIRRDGNIIGVKYWSTQQSTNGVAYKQEYFNVYDENGQKYGNVMKDKIILARVY